MSIKFCLNNKTLIAKI